MAPSSVDEAFTELLRRIELNPSRVALASQRYNAVKATLEGALSGTTVRQVGSFQRKTKIRPANLGDRLDIDLVVSFGSFFHYSTSPAEGVTPAKALETVRRALASNDIYRVMPQGQDHPVVRLEYADRMAIELIPAYEDRTGQHPRAQGLPACYIIGISPGTWRVADYDYDALAISKLNASSLNKLVPTIKMVKAYFRAAGVPLKSFHTEVLVANIVPSTIANWEANKYRYGYNYLLASFLSQASKTVAAPVTLHGSYSPSVDSGLGQSTLSSIGTFLAARAEVAWRLCKDPSVMSALSGWREFFGDPFPA